MTISNNSPYYLIYCRVSSAKQVLEGDGLGSQKKRCENWIKSVGGKVEYVFEDRGVSGGIGNRPATNELLDYIDASPHKSYVIVFDDISRLARDIKVHWGLRLALKARGAELKCLNFNFDDSPEGEFVENVIASTAQLSRQQNKRQVIQKMKARLECGYWPFCPPLSFKSVKDVGRGKVLVFNEPYASIHAEAIRLFADDQINSQTKMRDYILGKYKDYGISRSVSKGAVEKLLKDPLFYGFIEYPKWQVARIKGQHKGLVEHEMFDVVQAKLIKEVSRSLGKNILLIFP